MWITVVVSLLIAWCVTSVPLALVVARVMRGPQSDHIVAPIPTASQPTADIAA